MKGVVKSIYIVGTATDSPVSVMSAHAVPGKGLEGDRYYYKSGTWSHRSDRPRDVTLIDTGALESVQTEYDITLEPGEHRRNIETIGVPLTELVDKVFRIGSVTLQGIRICHPCAHLVEITGKRPLLKGLVNSGLFAEVLTEGVITVGDYVEQD